MVDISHKNDIVRIATATGSIKLKPETIKLIKESKIEKGDVISAAKLVAISSVKRTPNLLPLCHPIPISNVSVDVKLETDMVNVTVTVKSISKTGVEMEALCGVSIALLNIWDMVKQYEKDNMGQYPITRIQNIHVVKKIKEGL